MRQHRLRSRSRGVLLLAGIGVAGALVVLVGFGVLGGENRAREAGGARSVILFIGDGVGAAHRDAIQLATVGPRGRLSMDGLPYTGMVSTNSVNSETFVTDSAAAATAMSSGEKTVNGAAGVNPEGEAVTTILEQAQDAGKSTGLVSTGEVTGATPAAFAAHVKSRDEQAEIARQYIEESRPDVLLGGGEDYWYPEGNAEEEAASQGDRGNLVEAARESGYEYVTDAEELAAATGPRLLGLFANEAMFTAEPEPDGVYDPSVPLAEMTGKAIETLSQNPEGFFLMVEEEATDEMGHVNNGELTIKSGRALDESVALALDYAEANPDTLLITVGDHECCGLAVEQLDRERYPDENVDLPNEDGPFDVANSDYQFIVGWSTAGHTGVDVPLTATGPGGEHLVGNYENTHIHEVMAEALGVGSPSANTSGPARVAAGG